MFKKISILLGVGLLSSVVMASSQIMSYSIQDGLSSAEAKHKLGSNVQFYFAEKPNKLKGQIIIRASTSRKSSRGFDEPCHRAFLLTLLQLKKEAEMRNSHFVVNIASNYNKKLVFNKETYQCSVGLWSVEVALQGDIMESNTTVMSEAEMTPAPEPIVNEPTGPAVLEIEPVVIRPSVMPRSVSEPVTVKAKPTASAPTLTPAMQLRLSALKSLYEAGELDKQTYEQQKQQILND